ncbi:hypothetical protein BgiBS90_030351, partial [Biomphalaria glabrata]
IPISMGYLGGVTPLVDSQSYPQLRVLVSLLVPTRYPTHLWLPEAVACAAATPRKRL